MLRIMLATFIQCAVTFATGLAFAGIAAEKFQNGLPLFAVAWAVVGCVATRAVWRDNPWTEG